MPSFFMGQLHGHQPLESPHTANVASIQENWSRPGGPEAQYRTTSERLMEAAVGVGMVSAGLYGGYKAFPHLFPSIYSNQQGFADFLYRSSLAVENLSTTNPVGRYFASISNVLTKAMGMSDFFGAFVTPRGPQSTIISLTGEAGADTLKYLQRELGVDPKLFRGQSSVELSYDPKTRTGSFHRVNFEYSDIREGKPRLIANRGAAIQSNIAMDIIAKGKLSTGLITASDHAFGLYSKVAPDNLPDGERFIARPRVVNMFAQSNFVPISNQGRFGSGKGKFARLSWAYISSTLQRTADLIDEFPQEFQRAGRVLIGEAPVERASAFASKLGIMPRIGRYEAGTQLLAYTGHAMRIGGGLLALNQVAHWQQSDNPISSLILGPMGQAAIGAYAGHTIWNKFMSPEQQGRLVKKFDPTIAGKSVHRRLGSRGATGALIGGAIGLGTSFLPGFSEGPLRGIAGLVGGAQLIRSHIGEITGLNAIRRKVNEIAPGLDSIPSVLGLGLVGGLAYANIKHRSMKHAVDYGAVRSLLSSADLSDLGDASSIRNRIGTAGSEKLNARIAKMPEPRREAALSLIDEFLQDQKTKTSGRVAQKMNFQDANQRARVSLLTDAISNYSTEQAFKVIKENQNAKGFARITGGINQLIERGHTIRGGAYTGLALAAGLFLATGQLGTKESPDQLRRQLRGDELVEVRRGQLWEAGVSHIEGEDILYWRRHWLARLGDRSEAQARTGGMDPLSELFHKNFTYEIERRMYYEDPKPISGAFGDSLPFIRPLLAPLHALPFIKAPKLMNVDDDQWVTVDDDGQIIFKEVGSGLDSFPVMELGGLGGPAPISPYSNQHMFGHQIKELMGLGGFRGFMGREALNFFTGHREIGADRPVLESARESTSLTRRFYEEQTGGQFLGIPFASEPIRRFLVKQQLETEVFNPIENAMPSWMPEILRRGGTYSTFRGGGGSHRLPGSGYAAHHPELAGIDPEDYTPLHRVKILGDVAPWSPEYREAIGQAYQEVALGNYTYEQHAWLRGYQRGIEARKDKLRYNRYDLDLSNFDRISGRIQIVDPEKFTFRIEGYGATFTAAGVSADHKDMIYEMNMSWRQADRQRQAAIRRFKRLEGNTVQAHIGRTGVGALDEYGNVKAAVNLGDGTSVSKMLIQQGAANVAVSAIDRFATMGPMDRQIANTVQHGLHGLGKLLAPLDYIGPAGLGIEAKLLQNRDPIEQYKSQVLYGTDIQLWQKPWEHWVKPAIRTAAGNYLGLNVFGSNDRHNIEQYYDRLEYYKWRSLEQAALDEGRIQLAGQYRRASRQTTFGASGFGSVSAREKALSGKEQKFFRAFASEVNAYRQQQILDMLPEDKRRIMANTYIQENLRYMNALEMQKALNEPGQKALRLNMEVAHAEGFAVSPDLKRRFEMERAGNESYSDWIRRQELERYFAENHLPEPDFVGFNPAVDLEDFKVREIQNTGMSLHSFNVYPSTLKMLPRKPYVGSITDPGSPNHGRHAHNNINGVARAQGTPLNQIRYMHSSPQRSANQININIDQTMPTMIQI